MLNSIQEVMTRKNANKIPEQFKAIVEDENNMYKVEKLRPKDQEKVNNIVDLNFLIQSDNSSSEEEVN